MNYYPDFSTMAGTWKEAICHTGDAHAAEGSASNKKKNPRPIRHNGFKVS